MHLIETFKKQGGWRLLRQYWSGGAFFTAVGQLLLLGKSRTALEILRLAAQLKCKQKLERRYRHVLDQLDSEWVQHPGCASDKVWICWLQGMQQAPELVQRCYRSVQENLAKKKVILLTEENLFDYIELPDYIVRKWKNGQITHTHMTDLVRLELLIRHGGLWLDATVFCSGGEIPDYFFDSELFFFQCLKPGRDGHPAYVSSWLMQAKTNNKILSAVRALCHAYWRENDSMWDYFLLHDFLSIALERYAQQAQEIIPRDNAAPHALQLRLFEQYDERCWRAIKEQTPFHKLTYKFDPEKEGVQGTYYQVLFGGR